jgi:two-component system nitrogen regulation response regulator GlnG
MTVLVRHRWPGNVRELENVIYRSAVIAQGDAILVKDLPIEICAAVGIAPASTEARADSTAALNQPVPQAGTSTPASPKLAPPLTIDAALDFIFEQLKSGDLPIMPRLQREMIERAMAADGGDEVKAAHRLGLRVERRDLKPLT